jgi:ATP-dependent Lhr-like helicase
VISLGQPHSFALDTVFGFVPSQQAEQTLVQALLDRPMFEVRWRWNVTRSLTVLRRRSGKKVPPHLVKMRAADMLSVVFPQAQACAENLVGPREVPDHPLVFETVRDCLVEAMDARGLRGLLEQLERGDIRVLARDTVEPSPLSHELINANPYAYLDDAPLEERRTRAVQMRRGLPAAVAETSAALDPAAIALAESEVAPTVRDADELHDALLALWLVPEPFGEQLAPGARDWFAALVASGRACRLRWVCDEAVVAAWVATERLGAARAVLGEDVEAVPAVPTPSYAVFPSALDENIGAARCGSIDARSSAIIKIVGAHLDHRGPLVSRPLAAELGLHLPDIIAALLALEGDGAILRGSFSRGPRTVREALAAADDSDALAATEWCNRRVLARIHRLTLAKLRREIEPVSAAALMRFLLRWQRVARHRQLIGPDGLVRALEQLQGYESAAGGWEREILPTRLHGYDPSWLDQLCLAGHVVWCRLSPRKTLGPEDAPARNAPSRSAPLTLMLRKDAGWLRAAATIGRTTADPAPLGDLAARVHDFLGAKGASFLADLVTVMDAAPDAIEDALWELVGAGLATADGFASLRVLVDRRRGEVKSHFDRQGTTALPPVRKWQEALKRVRTRDRERPGHALRALPTAAGRWSLLPVAPAELDVEASARQLLLRYGVVFRDLLARETSLPPWRDLLVVLRRLEARGEIRGGRFVTGFVGEQFALPEALDELRAVRQPGAPGEVTRVAATDPLNLVGVLSPGPRVPAIVGNAVLYVDGQAVASLEAGALVHRAPAPSGARIDDDLTYHPPPRPVVTASQAALPL